MISGEDDLVSHGWGGVPRRVTTIDRPEWRQPPRTAARALTAGTNAVWVVVNHVTRARSGARHETGTGGSVCRTVLRPDQE
jgi:hypothetical protein